MMKKYNKIMGVFTKTVVKLDAVAESNKEREVQKTVHIKSLKAEAIALADEAAACYKTIDKINEFLN
jgi:hypothetical protein